jgi:protein-disulfide isomerase-like protein with CxxC motif
MSRQILLGEMKTTIGIIDHAGLFGLRERRKDEHAAEEHETESFHLNKRPSCAGFPTYAFANSSDLATIHRENDPDNSFSHGADA